MPTRIDFTEISPANNPSGRSDEFEQFAATFLENLGFKIIERPGRGADHGKDLLVSETVRGLATFQEKIWLVSAKHFAHSKKSVYDKDEIDPVGRVRKFNADGFMTFYSTIPSASLVDTFSRLRTQTDFYVFDSSSIENHLLENINLGNTFKHFFPTSYKAYKHYIFDTRFELTAEGGHNKGIGNFSKISLDITEFLDKSLDGLTHIGNPEMEASLVACLLAAELRNNRFKILEKFVTFSPMVWKHMIFLLKKNPPNFDSMAEALETCTDSFMTRLLILIAGELQAEQCVHAICKQFLFGGIHQYYSKAYEYLIIPFKDVVKRSLSSMPESSSTVIEEYLEKAKANKLWSKKRLLENILKKLRKSSHPKKK